jgi:hypothetical protein
MANFLATCAKDMTTNANMKVELQIYPQSDLYPPKSPRSGHQRNWHGERPRSPPRDRPRTRLSLVFSSHQKLDMWADTLQLPFPSM